MIVNEEGSGFARSLCSLWLFARAILPDILLLGATVAHQRHHAHHPEHHSGPSRRQFLSSLMSAAVFAPWLMGQTQPQTPADIAEQFRKRSEDYEKEGLAWP